MFSECSPPDVGRRTRVGAEDAPIRARNAVHVRLCGDHTPDSGFFRPSGPYTPSDGSGILATASPPLPVQNRREYKHSEVYKTCPKPRLETTPKYSRLILPTEASLLAIR